MTSGTINTAAPKVLLVGYEDRENLGLRYLLSSVRNAGFEGEILRLGQDNEALVRELVRRGPTVVGLSLIFQYMAPDFARLVAALRDAGLRSHIAMGGHFPSFEWHKVLECSLLTNRHPRTHRERPLESFAGSDVAVTLRILSSRLCHRHSNS